MLDMTVLFRDITGKEPETVEKEELDRLKTASDLGNDFLNFYNENKIFFDEESCKLIAAIGGNFKSSHAILYGLKRMNLEPSSLTIERTNEAIRLVREETPPLKVQLEGRLRSVLEE